MNTRFEERLTSNPEIPKEFGEDGGHFYRYYDALADEVDDDMVKSLKAQLDGILIYAGLFAGVNSAFLALTLPRPSADPADDTNAILLQLLDGDNCNVTSMGNLPSALFSPAPGILPVNILFSLSLTLALLAAFLAVLGQQWLVHYRKRSGGGAEAQRWEQLRRHLAAKRWCLERALDGILPSLLQLSLVIFCIALALYLSTFSMWLCYTVAIPMGLALACVLFMACSAAIDHSCPFQRPLSRILQLFLPRVTRFILKAVGACISMVRSLLRQFGGALGLYTLAFYDQRRSSFALWLANDGRRPPEPVERLRAIAAKRILCTSEDTGALICTAINFQALKSKEDIMWLLDDEEFYDHLTDGQRSVYQNTINPKPSSGKAIQGCAYYSSFLHLTFSFGSANAFFPPHRRPTLSPDAWVRDADSIMVNELKDTVSALNQRGQLMQMHLPPKNAHPSALTLFQDLIDAILNTDDSCRLRSWFVGYDALYQSSESPTPLSASMHAGAAGSNIKPDVPLGQRLRIVCDMLTNYHRFDARSTLDLIKDESRTFRPHNWDQSDRKLSIYLIEHALHLSNDPSLDSDSLGFVAAQAIEFIQSLVSPATQLESVNQKVVVKDHFSRCLKVLFETISCMNDLGMWSSRKYRMTSTKISGLLLGNVEISFEYAERNIWILDDPTLSNVLDLRNVIMDRRSNQPSSIVIKKPKDVRWSQDIHDELQSAFEKVESVLLADRGLLHASMNQVGTPIVQSTNAEAGPSTSSKGKGRATFEDAPAATL